MGGGNHNVSRISIYPFGHVNRSIFKSIQGDEHPYTNGNVVIGNDVWIASNVTIMSGVTVSDGAVIAANSHVVKDVKPYSIVGGNPARQIALRFESTIIEKLLQIRWWNWPIEKINLISDILISEISTENLKKLITFAQIFEK